VHIKLLFLTSHLLNIHKAFPRHTHFKPLSENGGTHNVPLQNSLSVTHQSQDYPLLCSFHYMADYTEKKSSVI